MSAPLLHCHEYTFHAKVINFYIILPLCSPHSSTPTVFRPSSPNLLRSLLRFHCSDPSRHLGTCCALLRQWWQYHFQLYLSSGRIKKHASVHLSAHSFVQTCCTYRTRTDTLCRRSACVHVYLSGPVLKMHIINQQRWLYMILLPPS